MTPYLIDPRGRAVLNRLLSRALVHAFLNCLRGNPLAGWISPHARVPLVFEGEWGHVFGARIRPGTRA